jgi:hypothetical protein
VLFGLIKLLVNIFFGLICGRIYIPVIEQLGVSWTILICLVLQGIRGCRHLLL